MKVESEQQKGMGEARLMYFEAMCLGCHAVGLDHGNEDGDVAQRTALTACYTDTQSVGGTLRKQKSHCCTKNETPEHYIEAFGGKQSYPCDLHCPNAWLCPWRVKMSDTNFRITTFQEFEMFKSSFVN